MTKQSIPIFLVGFSGCGKSSAAHKMAGIMHGNSIDIDRMIEHQTGKSISEIFEQEGENTFRRIEQDLLHCPWLLSHSFIATGGGCPCFFDNMLFMNSVGITVYLQAPASVLAHRVKHRKTARPLLAETPDDQLIEEIEHQLLQREHFYSQAQIIFPAINFNPYQLLHAIDNKIK